MAIVVDDNTPDFLREFLISQGVISVKDTETGETGVVPIQPRRRRLNTGGGMEGDFEEGSPITTAASGDILDTLRGLFSSDDNIKSEMDDDYTVNELVEAGKAQFDAGLQTSANLLSPDLARQEYFSNPFSDVPQTSGNSVLDGAVNLFSGFGNFVDNSLSKIGGLFSGGISNPFDFDFTPSIDDRYGPMGPLSGAATAFMDDNLSTDRKVGQIIGGLGAGLGLATIPGGTVLGLLSAGLGRMGAHHDFDPRTDYNLNFDTRSGRTDWGSTTDGAGGSQYGSLSNENMIEDIAKDNPDYEISLNEGKDGYITAEQWVDVNNALKNDPFAEGINPSEAFSAFADSSGDMFQSFGGGTLGEALTEYGQTGTGAIMNEAGAIADKLGLGYTETSTLADEIAAAAEQGVPMGLLGVDALDLDMSMGDLDGGDSGGGSFDFDMGDMGFGEGDFGTDGII